MKEIIKNISNEIVINKSKFITNIYKVKSILEVKQILENLKKDYKDATHICYAYSIGAIKKASDDGEPSHTAGMPILNVIEKNELNNVLAVVVRYFGGIKLGAGGLTRAYSNSISKALELADITDEKNMIKIRIEFDYRNQNEVNYILKDYNISYKEYDDNIIYEFEYEDGIYPSELDKYIIKKEMV